MSTSETLLPSATPSGPGRSWRKRFAGERLGAWLFAASFSIGIWGLALKILTPTHPTTVAASDRTLATLAPSDAADGRATIVWLPNAAASGASYRMTDVVPVAPPPVPTDSSPPRD
jgi:hypothetical protein